LNLPDGPPRDEEGPVFAEPWQAQAFALTVRLHETGAFAWTEWAATLAEELKAGAARGLGGGEHYYEHWLAALEHITQRHGLADAASLAGRKADWARAYRETPHGQPVELGQHHHDTDHDGDHAHGPHGA
jgi:nitrile hydratase accessory protein